MGNITFCKTMTANSKFWLTLIVTYMTISMLGAFPTAFANETRHQPLNNDEAKKPLVDTDNYDQSIILLEDAVKIHSDKITTLEAAMEYPNQQVKSGISFEVWAGLLLAASGLLLTIIGVGIALLSIFGYRKLIKSSKEAAENVSKEIAVKTSTETINKVIAIELARLLETGKFDALIQDMIENIAFRGITRLNELDENEQN